MLTIINHLNGVLNRCKVFIVILRIRSCDKIGYDEDQREEESILTNDSEWYYILDGRIMLILV